MRAVERATRKTLKSLRDDGRVTDESEALASLAIVLAREIDTNGGDASVARELRLTLDQLRKGQKRNDGDAFDAWAGELSTAVGDPEITGT